MTLRLLIALIMLAHAAYTGARVALALFGIQLGASPFTVGVLVSLLSVVPMFMAVSAGRWTDRTGAFKPILIALVAVTAGALLPALRPQLSSLYVASVLLGTGFMLAHIAVTNAIGVASTAATRTRGFTILALGFSTTTVAGPLLAGFAIDLAGHARAFLLLAAFPAVGLALMAAVGNRGPQPAVPMERPKGLHVMDLVRHAPLRAVFIVSGLLSMAWDMFTFMVPVQGARIGLSASTIGIIMASFGVATFVVRAALPWIARNLSEWQTLTGALAITAFVYFLFPLFSAAPVLMGLAFLLGLGLGATQPMVLSLIHLVAPPGRTGEAVGVRTTLMNTSHTALPLAFGAVGAAVGMVPAFWALALVLTAGGVFAGRRKGDAGPAN